MLNSAILVYWKIFFEIAILWYAIYMVLLFVKGTRSEQLIKGLLVIAIIFVVTQQLGLNAINWAMTRLFPISIIALVIIFQPELRRGLAQLGQLGIYQENVEAVDEIAKAAAVLSKNKIGGLVVIERETGLKAYSETGVSVDAKVTSYLLVSIFTPQSPLHDGAVIVQHGRIAAAGCVLPLTQEDRALPKVFGMRHRAAMGITEETDAVCVVVSEETGAVSIAYGGKLVHGLNEEGMIKELKHLLYRPSARRSAFSIAPRLFAKAKNRQRK